MAIHNTHEQLLRWRQAGLEKRPVAIIRAWTHGKNPTRDGWYIYSPWYNTDPEAHWLDNGKKHFGMFRATGNTKRERTADALRQAITWANVYGSFNFIKNRQGDYVPKEINDMFPIQKSDRTNSSDV